MSPTLIPSARAAALCRVAFFNGVQTGLNDEPLFELWTLRQTLSAALIAGGTFARETIEAGLARAS